MGRKRDYSKDDRLFLLKAMNNKRSYIKKLEKEIGPLHKRTVAQRKKLKDLEADFRRVDKKNGVVKDFKTESLQLDKTKEYVPDEKCLFKPFPGPQTDFLQSTEDEVLFSGGRGSGKSLCLVADPLRWVQKKNFKALVIRRTMPELRELIGRAKEMYLQAFPKCRWREQDKMFVFPSGATIEFGYCDKDDDVERYRGQEYNWLGIDEISQYKDPTFLDRIKMSLRSSDPEMPNCIRASTNPSGAGRLWVKDRWVLQGPQNKTIRIVSQDETGLGWTVTRKWIHSTVDDNPALKGAYKGALAAIENENLRKQWLEGDWDAAEGLAFDEFHPDKHVVEPFEIPSNWPRFRACDWGYSSLAVCLWFAVDFDYNLWVYREYATKGKKADEFARNILTLESQETVRYGIVDGSIGDRRGSTAPTIDEEMRSVGCYWRYADKSPGSRMAGKMLVHKYLSEDPRTGEPKLKIFKDCTQLIRELSSLELDRNNNEDVDTDLEDHAYDALRYGLTSRPNISGDPNDFLNQRRYDTRPVIVSTTAGY